jgi:hypothetical protein
MAHATMVKRDREKDRDREKNAVVIDDNDYFSGWINS